jgi:group I intron endonuclease
MDKSNIAGIYLIINLVNDKIYIGESCDVPTRLNGHRSLLRLGSHSVAPLQNDFNEMGEATFDFMLLEVCSSDTRQRRRRETMLIRMMNSDDARYGYNQSDGWGWSNEARQRDTERKFINKRKYQLLPGVTLYTPMLTEYLHSCIRGRTSQPQTG